MQRSAPTPKAKPSLRVLSLDQLAAAAGGGEATVGSPGTGKTLTAALLGDTLGRGSAP